MMEAMDFIYPLLSAVSESLAKTMDKFNYQRNKIVPRQLLFLLFVTMVAGTLISTIFVHQALPAVTWTVAALVIFMICLSFGQNLFDYVGLHTKNLSLREPISNFEPVLASFLAYILFPSERNIKYVVAIVLGTIILYLSNSNRKLRLEFDRGTLFFFLGVVCSAVLASVYKLGLENMSPFYLLLFRSAGVLVLLCLFFRPEIKGIRRNQTVLGVGTGVVYIIGNLSRLYSIKYLGLNFTIMILLLGPVIIYAASWLVLKEKVLLKQIVASAALLAVVVWAIYL